MTVQQFTTEELNNEIWRDVVGYEGIYSVSNLGRVRRDWYATKRRTGNTLRPGCDEDGYLRVVLHNQGAKTWKVHHLVAFAFIGRRPEGMEVNHIKEPKTNNRASNLEYLTHGENVLHAWRTGLVKPRRGDASPSTKIKTAEIPELFQLRKNGMTYKAIGSIFGITASQVCAIYNGKSRTLV